MLIIRYPRRGYCAASSRMRATTGASRTTLCERYANDDRARTASARITPFATDLATRNRSWVTRCEASMRAPLAAILKSSSSCYWPDGSRPDTPASPSASSSRPRSTCGTATSCTRCSASRTWTRAMAIVCASLRPCRKLTRRQPRRHFQPAGSQVASRPPASTGSRNAWAAAVTSSSVAQTK